MKKSLVFGVFGIMLFGASLAVAENPRETLTQISTLDALISGIYDGQYTIKDVRQYGDTGLGTFQGLDGELLMMDGTIYKIAFDGTVSTPDDATLIPFVAVTFFDIDQEKPLAEDLTLKDFPATTDALLATPNLFYAVRLDGTFKKMKTRSVPKQEKPYPPLTDVVKKQSVFEFENVEGTIIGLRCPSYVKGLNAPGYHLHFLTKDGKAGGHVLDFTVKEATLKIDQTAEFSMIIPENQDFYQHQFAEENSAALQQVLQSPKK